MSTVNKLRIAAVAGASLALVLATGAPAHAASTGTLSDNFEAPDAGSVWTMEHGDGAIVEYSSTAHSPSHEAYGPWAPPGGWSSVGRSIYLPVVLNSTSRCSVTIWVRPLGVTRFNVEVINPSDWTYISLRTVTLGTSSGYQPYQQISVPTWTPHTRDVVFRVSQIDIGTDTVGANIDDLKVACKWI
jgi:hypothetical protein